MATKTTTTLIDDIDGSEAVETIEFALDGQRFEIDLNTKHATKLRTALLRYVDNAREVRVTTELSGARSRGPANRRHDLQVVREWARENGYEVSDRGRITLPIQQAFDAAHR